jgi:hypothetical protein
MKNAPKRNPTANFQFCHPLDELNLLLDVFLMAVEAEVHPEAPGLAALDGAFSGTGFFLRGSSVGGSLIGSCFDKKFAAICKVSHPLESLSRI